MDIIQMVDDKLSTEEISKQKEILKQKKESFPIKDKRNGDQFEIIDVKEEPVPPKENLVVEEILKQSSPSAILEEIYEGVALLVDEMMSQSDISKEQKQPLIVEIKRLLEIVEKDSL